MATGDIVKGSDGLATIKIGLWAKDKLFYVKNFCDIFNTGMKNKWHIRTYIDLFSGPGMCIIERMREEIPGSPIIALRCKFPFTHYFFNDVESKFINALEARTSSCSFAKVKCFNKDCNLVIPDLLRDLPHGSLDFCFIDPFNWEIKFNSIRKLAEKRSMDLLITFHIGNIKRNLDKPPQELSEFFPDPNWQQIYNDAMKRGEKAERVLLNIYEEGLRNIGYKVIRDHIFEKNVRNVRLYYLIFASKHKMGAHFWDEVTKRSEAGQQRMQFNKRVTIE